MDLMIRIALALVIAIPCLSVLFWVPMKGFINNLRKGGNKDPSQQLSTVLDHTKDLVLIGKKLENDGLVQHAKDFLSDFIDQLELPKEKKGE